jgi:hypothetical protein
LRVSLKNAPSGAKAQFHFALLMYGLKPVPFKLTHYLLFQPFAGRIADGIFP